MINIFNFIKASVKNYLWNLGTYLLQFKYYRMFINCNHHGKYVEKPNNDFEYYGDIDPSQRVPYWEPPVQLTKEHLSGDDKNN